ncbi:hypothetical protein D3C83_12000 [compost metagenome]
MEPLQSPAESERQRDQHADDQVDHPEAGLGAGVVGRFLVRSEADLGRKCVRNAGAARADMVQVAAGEKQPRGRSGRECREEGDTESGHLCRNSAG